MSERTTVQRQKTPLPASAPPQYLEREAAFDPNREADATHRPPHAAVVRRAALGHDFGAIAIQPPEPQPAAQAEAQIGAEGGALDEATQERIEERRGEGTALDAATRGRMERAFATSFADVRIHADGESDTLNRSLSARAFTTGSDLFFQPHAFQPGTRTGDTLIAHELTHVVQQRAAPAGGPMTVSAVNDPAEQEAEAVAEQVAAGEPVPGIGGVATGRATVAPARIQRQGGDPNATANPPATAAPPTGPIKDKVPSQIDLKSLQIGFNIPEDTNFGGAVLGKAYTTERTFVTLTVSEKGIHLSLNPPLHIRPISAWANVIVGLGTAAYFALSDCEWSSLDYDFATASISAMALADTGIGKSIQGSVKETVTEKITALFAGTKVAAAGYDPLTDPDIMATLSAIQANGAKIGGGGGGDLDIRGISTKVSAAFTAAIKTDDLDIPAGTSAALDIHWQGSLKDVSDPAKRKIDWIDIESGGITLLYGDDHKPVARVTHARLSQGGAFEVISWEDLGPAQTAVGGLGLAGLFVGILEAAGSDGNPMGAGLPEDRMVKGAQIGRDLVAKKINETVGPKLVELIRQNRNVIPGVDIAALLGL